MSLASIRLGRPCWAKVSKRTPLAATVTPTPSAEPHSPGAGSAPNLRAQLRQDATASDQARQASLGAGTQYNYFGDQSPRSEAAVSIAVPIGQRDADLPLRGREILLAELADPNLGGVRVVHGLGGCGKTRLALEAAWQAQQRSVEVWWVSAADESRLVAGMHAVGRRLGITDTELRHSETADLIWQRLSGREQRWLLVIDSADDPQVLAGPVACVGDGTGWLRPVQSDVGMVLVTSRDGRIASWGSWCRRHAVGMLPADQATQVLADYAGHNAGLGTEDEAAALAARLGGLPLALKIAGSYLAESAAVPAAFAGPGLIRSYRAYRQAIEEGQLDVAFPAPGGAELTPEQARGLIGRTWDLTLDLMETRQLPEARPMLRLVASMAEAPLPHEVLLNPEVLGDSRFFPGITGPRVWQILQALIGFGLIDLTGIDDDAVPGIRLHPLVRDTSRPRPTADADDHNGYLELAARLLEHTVAEKLGKPEDPVSWPIWQLLVPHAVYVFEAVISGPGYPDIAVEHAASAAGRAAHYQSEQGLYSRAKAAQHAVLAAQIRVLGPDHPHTLETRHQVAREMAHLGDYDGALAEYREVLAARLRVLGPDHPSTLDTRYEIAAEMSQLGDYDGALAECRDVLAAQLRVLGPDHPSTLDTRYEIAAEMAQLGDHDGALAEYRDLLAAEQRIQEPDHPSTLFTRHEIAREIAELGDHDGALAEYREVLAARLRGPGPDHPSTLDTRYEIAREMAQLGDHDGALAGYREVLAAELRVLGPDHPSTLVTRYEIAREMAQLGDHDGALAEYREVLAARLRMLGPDHPSTLVTRHEIRSEERR